MRRALTLTTIALIVLAGCSSTSNTADKPAATQRKGDTVTTTSSSTPDDPPVDIKDLVANTKRCAAIVKTDRVFTHNDYLACINYLAPVPILTCADGTEVGMVAINDQGYFVTEGHPARKVDKDNPPPTC